MAEIARPEPRRFDSGVPNLDLVLGGGLQEHNSYLFVGASGTGKSVLSHQIAFHRARQGERVLLVTGLDEPHRNLLEHLTAFSYADLSLIGPQLETVSLVPFLERPVPEKIDILRTTVLNARPRLVIIDGLRSLEAFTGTPQGMYQFLYGLTSWLAVEGITLLLTKNTGAAPLETPEFSLVDGGVVLQRDLASGSDQRRLWVWKMRGQRPLEGLHSYSIDRDGVTVWPRPQATFHLEARPPSRDRAAFGVPGLDSMLAGGLPEATSTLLAGGPGTGKTVLGLAFLAEGARLGQPGLWLGFRESRSQLLGRSGPWAADLTGAEARGTVQFMTMAPLELDPNHLAGLLQQTIAGLKVRRLVVDAVEALDQAFASARSVAEFMTWLVQYLPQQGVTGLLSERLPGLDGQRLGPSTVPLSDLAENVIGLRQVEAQSQLRRTLAVVKMRDPGYDPTVRELILEPRGITVGEPLEVSAAQPARAST